MTDHAGYDDTMIVINTEAGPMLGAGPARRTVFTFGVLAAADGQWLGLSEGYVVLRTADHHVYTYSIDKHCAHGLCVVLESVGHTTTTTHSDPTHVTHSDGVRMPMIRLEQGFDA